MPTPTGSRPSGSGLRAADHGDVQFAVVDDPAVAFIPRPQRLADIVAAGATPLVLGGDALVSVPVLQVLSGKLRGRLGVVAFTPAYEVAPEPLYSAGSRWARALELGVLAPANLALVGGRAAPPGAPARVVLDKLGATAFSLEDILRDGMRARSPKRLWRPPRPGPRPCISRWTSGWSAAWAIPSGSRSANW